MSKGPLSPGHRLGWQGYASILRYLQRWPSTSKQVAHEFGLNVRKGPQVMRALHVAGLVHIAGWHQNEGARQRPLPIWAFGIGQDETYPGRKQHPRPDRSKNVRAELLALASIVSALGSAITVADLAAVTGCNRNWIYALLRHMRAIGFARVADYQRQNCGGRPTAMWELGSGPNAPRPQALPRDVVNARNWAARKGRQHMLKLIAATAAPVQINHELEAA